MTKKGDAGDMGDVFQTNREVLRDIHAKTNRIYNIMFGDEDAPGIVKRVKNLEHAEKKTSLLITIVSAIAAGIGIVGQAVYGFFGEE